MLRYHVIDMPDRMDIELGLPIDSAAGPAAALEAQRLPAGRYAVLTYRGVENGIAANKRLLDWIAAQGERPASHETDRGTAFAARCETYLSDAEAQPDQAQWDIEIAVLLAE